MAILSKRKATKSLPGARDFADRSGRTGLTSVTRPADVGTVDSPRIGTGAKPASSLVGTSSITNVGSGSSPVSTTKTPTTSTAVPTLGTKTTPASLTTKTTAKPSSVMAGKATTGTSTSKPSLTSTTKPATTKTTTTKPAVSTSTTKPTSITTSGTGTTKMPTITTKPSSGSSTLSKTLTGAATGAVLGAGTKAIIDKLTGGSKTSGGTSGTGLKPGSSANLPSMGGGQGLKVPGSANKPAGIPSVVPKGGGATKPTGGTNTKPATGGSAGTVTPGGNYQFPSSPSGGTPYDDDGNLMPGWQLDEENNPVWVGLGDDTTTTDGTTTADSNTYVDEETGDVYKMASDGTWSLQDGDTTVASDGTTRGLNGGNTDTTVATNDGNTDLGDGYYQDEIGNIYNSDGSLFASIGEDGEYSLYEGDTTTDTTYADNSWTDPDTGEVWNMADDGTWSMEGGEDTYLADNTWTDPDTGAVWTMAENGDWSTDYTDDTDYTDYTLADNSDYTSYDDGGDYEVKGGGLITMMKNGGIPRFADGNLVSEDGMITDYAINDETGDLYMPMAQNEYGDYYTPVLGNQGYVRANALSNGEEEVFDTSSGTDFTPTPGVQYFDDGSYIQTFDDGSTMTVDSEGNVVDSSIGYQTSVDDYGNTTVTDGYGNIVSVYDPEGNVIPLGGGRVNQKPITNVGGSGGIRMTPVNKPQTPKEMIAEQKRAAEEKSTWQSIQDMIGGSGYLGAGAAGAILGSLLGNSDLLSGGTSGQNQQAIDMSKVGVLDPRTTDFGIGPANFVTYDQYGTPEEMPDLYGTELGKNLNAPGFNPVNEGDYGFDITEEAPTEEVTEEVQGMASGGQPQGGLTNSASTYFTYGKPVDPMQNLYNPQPMQQPQQPTMGGLNAPGMAPQGMPPQGMSPQGMSPQGMPNLGMPAQGMNQQGMSPQGMAPQGMQPQGMRSGGLPAWSNVPVTNGRLNFRDGAPVHGPGDGQSDDIPAMLADGEYVIDAETVAQIGNGSTKAGAKALDKFREGIRAHKRSAPINKIPPKTKALTSYLKGAK